MSTTTGPAAASAARLAPLAAACARLRDAAEKALDAIGRLDEARARDDLTGLALADQAEARLLDRAADFEAAMPLAALIDEEVEKLKTIWTREGWTPSHEAEVAEAVDIYCGAIETMNELRTACSRMAL